MFQYPHLLTHRKVLNLDNCCNVWTFLDEPNDYRGINPDGEDCLILMYLSNVLNDVHCTLKSEGYVCEKESKSVKKTGPIRYQ